MGKLFRDYEECESVIIKMCEDLTNESLLNVTLAINVCNSLMEDKDKIYRLTQSYIKCLWDIDEAIKEGFYSYFRNQAEEVKGLMSYHKKHCPENNTCMVCKNNNLMKVKMRNVYEGKKPRICVK